MINEIDKRSRGNEKYIDQAMKIYGLYEIGKNKRKASRSMFTQATVGRIIGEDR